MEAKPILDSQFLTKSPCIKPRLRLRQILTRPDFKLEDTCTSDSSDPANSNLSVEGVPYAAVIDLSRIQSRPVLFGSGRVGTSPQSNSVEYISFPNSGPFDIHLPLSLDFLNLPSWSYLIRGHVNMAAISLSFIGAPSTSRRPFTPDEVSLPAKSTVDFWTWKLE
ncbi:hypothetical protein GALMADRAFT_144033 [Galerina marginata CBS 339.88]|uniref:Uncharacterized protein n=1 Tax=Galerina marginata (strain CBS 339.88) TaxID=685588 RepID=A0A067SMU1_GALM3|nr:hypothetical protein GALMADRAFT_144033 [Galerina marginata CBS 339.88]